MRHNIKKIITLATCAVLLTACTEEATSNQSSEATKTETSQESKSSSVETKEKEDSSASENKEEKEKSGEINLKTDDFELKYIKHKVSKDYEGNPCLLYFYSFKNLKNEAIQPTVATMIKCFQNGVECDVATPKADLKEIGNDLKEVKKGGEINCVSAFLIEKGKEATIEAEPLFSLGETEKASQIIKIK